MIEVYAVKFEERLDDDLFLSLMRYVDKEKQERLQRYHNWEDAHRTLFADLFIRHIVMNKTGIKNENICFFIDRNKKPFLKNPENIFFNLSHSGNWIMCAIDHSPIGVDIEKIRPLDFSVCENSFSLEERQSLLQKSQTDRLFFFYTLWTLKESYIKAAGKGLSLPFDSFSIEFQPDGRVILFYRDKDIHDAYFRCYDFDNSYKAAVCAFRNEFPDSVSEMKIYDVIRHFV